jgi:hypothetical protein
VSTDKRETYSYLNVNSLAVLEVFEWGEVTLTGDYAVNLIELSGPCHRQGLLGGSVEVLAEVDEP